MAQHPRDSRIVSSPRPTPRGPTFGCGGRKDDGAGRENGTASHMTDGRFNSSGTRKERPKTTATHGAQAASLPATAAPDPAFRWAVCHDGWRWGPGVGTHPVGRGAQMESRLKRRRSRLIRSTEDGGSTDWKERIAGDVPWVVLPGSPGG